MKGGKDIFSIAPLNEQLITGYVQIPMKNAGKIKKGQEVIVKIHNYPYKEYGFLTGKIKHVSEVPTSGNYLAKVLFSQGTKTNCRIELPLMQKMEGRAEIITQSRSIFQSIMKPLQDRKSVV